MPDSPPLAEPLRIALVRHGRPMVEFSPGPSQHLGRWIEAYDRAGIDPALPPPARVRRIADAAAYTLSSDLPRAVESLRALAPEAPGPAERVFREASLPSLPSAPIQLDPMLWAGVARMGWFLGWSPGTESVRGARRRARIARHKLSALATAHGSVMLVGHGLMNALIAWELRLAGWRGPLWASGSYWSAAVYRKSAT